MRNYFTFGDYDSRDFGVFITRDGVYNAPRRVYRQIQVPGRNGDLMLDEGRFENIDVTYPCLIYAGFNANIEGLRNALLSQNGYVRITDSYHPSEYRLGCFADAINVSPQTLGDGGTFDITFNCKPQRFLISGEETVTLTGSGNIENPTLFASKPLIRVTFDDTTELIEPPYYRTLPYTMAGITFSDGGDGYIELNGTTTGGFQFPYKYNMPALPEGKYHLSGCPEEGSSSTCFQYVSLMKGNTTIKSVYDHGEGADLEISSVESTSEYTWRGYIRASSAGVNLEHFRIKPSLVPVTAANCRVYVGANLMTLKNDYPYLDVDSETQNCYYGNVNANQNIVLQNNDFPTLESGVNGIQLGAGVSKVEITPRWYIL